MESDERSGMLSADGMSCNFKHGGQGRPHVEVVV